MEDSNRLREINPAGIFHQDLQIDVLHSVRIDQATAFTGAADMRA